MLTRLTGCTLLLPLALVVPEGLAGQRGAGAVEGVVVAVPGGQPLWGVQVVSTSGRWTLTNGDGYFRLHGLTTGLHTIDFTHPDALPVRFVVVLDSAESVEIVVRLQRKDVVMLPPVTVEAEEQPRGRLGDFYRRAASGSGHFITRKDIEATAPRLLSDMLRSVPGLRVDCGSTSCRVWTFAESRRVAGRCPIQYFLDGVRYDGDIDQMTPDQVEGIEIYRGASTIPPEFNTGSAMCGVIAVWMRDPGRK